MLLSGILQIAAPENFKNKLVKENERKRREKEEE